jgi:hypothetical protein
VQWKSIVSVEEKKEEEETKPKYEFETHFQCHDQNTKQLLSHLLINT